MKLICESKEEKEYIIQNCCPDKIKEELGRYCYEICDSVSCGPCWENSGIEMEVKDDNNQNM